jgi:hypothetical protein
MGERANGKFAHSPPFSGIVPDKLNKKQYSGF